MQKNDTGIHCFAIVRQQKEGDKQKLDWMKKDAVLITPSRPSVLSPEALKDMRIIWDFKHEAWKTDACLKRKQEAVL